MNKLIITLTCILLAISISAQKSVKEIHQMCTKNGGTVGVFVEDELVSQGSGFFVAPNLMITNFHVIKDGDYAAIYLNEESEGVKVLGIKKIDEFNDLALLEIDHTNESFLKIVSTAPEIGDRIFSYGSPRGMVGTIDDGLYNGIKDFNGLKMMQISAQISPGSSGGPILNEDAEVIGVATSGFDGAGALNFAVPWSTLNEFLAGTENNKTVSISEQELIEGRIEGNGANSPFELGAHGLATFNKLALSKVKDLGLYLEIISSKADEDQADAGTAIELACKLFSDCEQCIMEVSSKNRSGVTTYPVETYLGRMRLLKYDRVEITWSDIQYVSDLKPGPPDENGDITKYYGVISISQRFCGISGGEIKYCDVTKKNIQVSLEAYKITTAQGDEKVNWEVFLCDIGVNTTN